MLPGERRLTIFRPGATRSGFAVASMYVGPRDDHDADESSSSEGVALSSIAPTVTTYGSLPGVVIVELPGPLFPAETTTVTPARMSTSTAAASGSVL